jgi:CHAT domain-containing protein/tetratricopeptide (TPR) repeat protein
LTIAPGPSAARGPRFALLVLFALLLGCRGLPPDETRTETIPLKPGSVHARTLTEGKPHHFRFHATADHFLHLSVEQKGIDVIVGLRDPSEDLLFEIDSPNGPEGPETVLAVAPVTGEYVLQVTSLSTSGKGAFTLLVHEVRRASPEDRRRANVAATLALAERQWQSGDFEEAAAGFRKALPYLERHGEEEEIAQAQWRLGTALFRTGGLRESATLLERSASRFRDLENGIGEARVLNNLGATWRFLGQPGRALEAYQRSLDLYRQAGVPEGEASAVNNIGLVFQSTGDLQGAITQYEEALGLWRHLGNRSEEATTLQNLGDLYMLIGHDTEGLDVLRRSLALREGERHQRERMSALVSLGWAEYLTGDSEAALRRYEESIALARRLEDPLAEVGALDRQGSALKSLGRLDEAAASYARALEISRAVGSLGNQAHTLANLGRLQLETGKIERARRDLQQSLDLMIATKDLNGEASVRLALGRLERRLGAFGPARRQIETALQRLEELRGGLNGPASRGNFLATRYEAYEDLVSLLMELDRREPERGHALEALEVAEGARARNLLDLMAGGPESAGVEELRRKGELQAEIRAMDERRRSLAGRNPQDPRLPGIAVALRHRALELDRLTVAVARTGLVPLTSRQIQDLADDQTLLVVYLLAEPASFAWTVDRERIVSHVLPGRKTIETLSRRVAAALPRSHERTVHGAAERAVRDLSKAILIPLGERLTSRPRLVLLPDGALNLVSFAALPAPSSGQPLLLDHEIVVVPSATVLVQQRRRLTGRRPAPKDLAALGDPIFSFTDPRLTRGRGDQASLIDDRGDPALGFGPLPRLPFTAEEVEAIARLVPADRRLVATGAAASRELVTSGALSHHRLLHFATHGLLHPVLPERSGIVLSLMDEKGQPRDGFLAAPDVAALDLPADLVVLSACQTGLGREVRGEGLVGLTQAFFRAGARGVVVSSWNVRDRATAQLMTRFYQRLLVDRLPPAAALRAAQLSLRSEIRTSSPSFWAAFSFHGDWQ